MDKQPITIEMVKQRIRNLSGRNIIIKVNNSRNRFWEYDGVIDKMYPYVFTVRAMVNEEMKTLSYTYSEVLTKTVRFYRKDSLSQSATSSQDVLLD